MNHHYLVTIPYIDCGKESECFLFYQEAPPTLEEMLLAIERHHESKLLKHSIASLNTICKERGEDINDVWKSLAGTRHSECLYMPRFCGFFSIKKVMVTHVG